MDMIERITDQILTDEGISLTSPLRAQYRSFAVSALKAMREPTDTMIDAGVDRLLQDGASVIDRDAMFCWQAMVDTALIPTPA